MDGTEAANADLQPASVSISWSFSSLFLFMKKKRAFFGILGSIDIRVQCEIASNDEEDSVHKSE